MKCKQLFVVIGVITLGLSTQDSFGQAGKKKQPAFPPEDSPLRQVAAKYKLSMNMLLFPDYFMSDEQFNALAKNDFKHSNLKEIVRGLNAYGFKATMPDSADGYRKQVYPLMLDFLKECGFVAVEIPVNGANLELCPALRKQIEERGLGVLAVGGSSENIVESLKARIDAAHALGANYFVGPVVLPFKQYPENAVGNDRVAWVKKRLAELKGPMREVAEYAKSKDVKLAVEPLNRFELPGMNRLQEAIQFTKMVDHPNFGVMIDTCHELSEGAGPFTFGKQVKTLMDMDRLFHCHISAIHRGRIDKSWINWQGFFGNLKKNGYQGNMSMEIFDATKPFSEAVHINRRQFENPMEVALSALLFSAKRLQNLK